ncbi:hypothetical protein [Symbioplanes lichenis]|uniref:hypothetical protein n=1 Tax=Symbioplanes lichenis TaxID=1629072 RepID=UPI00273944E8|nr:hypothetical protein [Actinoplanes lichenis]
MEARPDCPAERREHAGAELSRTVKDTVGVSIEAEVVAPGTLARSSGKLQRLSDRRR